MQNKELLKELKKLNLLFVDDNDLIIDFALPLFSQIFKDVQIAKTVKKQ